METIKQPTFLYHLFLDEAGDTTFFGKGKIPNVGENGVSNCFILGMLKINEPLPALRTKVLALQNQIALDPYFKNVPSIQKKNNSTGYFLHAKDDVPEVRKMAYEFIQNIDCSFEAVVGRKIYGIYEKKHNGKEAEFYADLLAHLLKNKLNDFDNLVLNIAHRSKCTTHTNLNIGLEKAIDISRNKNPDKCNCCKIVFNVQYPTTEPLLNISDYFLWALQRLFERGETRYYDFICEKFSFILDVYDKTNTVEAIYTYSNKLTSENIINKKSPSSH